MEITLQLKNKTFWLHRVLFTALFRGWTQQLPGVIFRLPGKITTFKTTNMSL